MTQRGLRGSHRAEHHGEQKRPGRPVIVTTPTARRGILSRGMLIVGAAMGLISFALGYLLHPM
jgi:hypothetical protein